MLKHFEQHPYTTRALAYAFNAVKGHRLAGKYERLACQRFIDDLNNADLPFWYSPSKAERACRFIERMPHTKGRWAARRELIHLEGWQCFIVCNLFGWVSESGLRRFRESYLKVSRKNAKSTLMAAIGNYMLTMDGEYGAEVYSGATNLKQALEVFGPARQMCVMTPKFCEAKGVNIGAQNLHIIDTNSKFEPLIGNPGDGANPSCAIVDEYHEHKTSDLVDTMRTGMGAREQALMCIITTAGDNLGGPCYDTEVEAKQVLDKVFNDDRQFVLIYDIDEDDDWTDPANLEKANPNIDVSVSREFLEAQLVVAIRSPAKQNSFKRKHLNVWVGAHTAWLNMEDFLACSKTLDIADFKTDDCYLPVDLASRIDLTTTPKIFHRVIDEKDHYFMFSRYYAPEKTIEAPENKHYQKWVNSSHLISTDGEEIDFNDIQADIEEDMASFNITEVPFDPWRADQLAQAVGKKGAEIVRFNHTVGNFSPAMYELEAAITSGRFHYDGNPITTWMASNVVARIDAKDNIYPRKQKPENKIDGIVAAIMAIGRIIAHKEEAENLDDFINDPVTG
jgi:phage terminase large subunit-like protein